jgi:hypothetical protein
MKKRARQIAQLVTKIAAAEQAQPDLLEKVRARYQALSEQERLEFIGWLAREFDVPREDVSRAVERLQDVPRDDHDAWSARLAELRTVIESPRTTVLARFAHIPGGMEDILELRADVLDAQRSGAAGLDPLEKDLTDLLNGWFNQGFLFIEEIDRTSSFKKIQFLKERELVHPMISLEEMGQRLGADRMCFALYHAAMPDEPVVFIEVALSRGLVRSIHDIIDDSADQRTPVTSPDTAIFYSINNPQNGLAGLGLAKVLVLRVTEALRARHPSLHRFATLSPIPGFLKGYLCPILEGRDDRFRQKKEDVLERFSARARAELGGRWGESGGENRDDFSEVLLGILARPDWIEDGVFCRHLEKPLREIAYYYIAEEQDSRGRPLNPVAGFHLGNGATIALRNVNFGANRSRRGFEESCGLMANYLYSRTTFQQISRAVQSLIPWHR